MTYPILPVIKMRILLRSNPSPDFPSRLLAGAAAICESGLSIIGRGPFGSGFMTGQDHGGQLD